MTQFTIRGKTKKKTSVWSDRLYHTLQNRRVLSHPAFAPRRKASLRKNELMMQARAAHRRASFAFSGTIWLDVVISNGGGKGIKFVPYTEACTAVSKGVSTQR